MPVYLETNKSKMKRISVSISHSGQIIKKDERLPKNAENMEGNVLDRTTDSDRVSEGSGGDEKTNNN